MTIEGEKTKKDESEAFLSQISDFFFLVRYKDIDYDKINLIQKELYTGYIAFLNITLRNKTNDMITIFDKTLNNYLNTNYIKNLDFNILVMKVKYALFNLNSIKAVKLKIIIFQMVLQLMIFLILKI